MWIFVNCWVANEVDQCSERRKVCMGFITFTTFQIIQKYNNDEMLDYHQNNIINYHILERITCTDIKIQNFIQTDMADIE